MDLNAISAACVLLINHSLFDTSQNIPLIIFALQMMRKSLLLAFFLVALTVEQTHGSSSAAMERASRAHYSQSASLRADRHALSAKTNRVEAETEDMDAELLRVNAQIQRMKTNPALDISSGRSDEENSHLLQSQSVPSMFPVGKGDSDDSVDSSDELISNLLLSTSTNSEEESARIWPIYTAPSPRVWTTKAVDDSSDEDDSFDKYVVQPEVGEDILSEEESDDLKYVARNPCHKYLRKGQGRLCFQRSKSQVTKGSKASAKKENVPRSLPKPLFGVSPSIRPYIVDGPGRNQSSVPSTRTIVHSHSLSGCSRSQRMPCMDRAWASAPQRTLDTHSMDFGSRSMPCRKQMDPASQSRTILHSLNSSGCSRSMPQDALHSTTAARSMQQASRSATVPQSSTVRSRSARSSQNVSSQGIRQSTGSRSTTKTSRRKFYPPPPDPNAVDQIRATLKKQNPSNIDEIVQALSQCVTDLQDLGASITVDSREDLIPLQVESYKAEFSDEGDDEYWELLATNSIMENECYGLTTIFDQFITIEESAKFDEIHELLHICSAKGGRSLFQKESHQINEGTINYFAEKVSEAMNIPVPVRYPEWTIFVRRAYALLNNGRDGDKADVYLYRAAFNDQTKEFYRELGESYYALGEKKPWDNERLFAGPQEDWSKSKAIREMEEDIQKYKHKKLGNHLPNKSWRRSRNRSADRSASRSTPRSASRSASGTQSSQSRSSRSQRRSSSSRSASKKEQQQQAMQELNDVTLAVTGEELFSNSRHMQKKLSPQSMHALTALSMSMTDEQLESGEEY